MSRINTAHAHPATLALHSRRASCSNLERFVTASVLVTAALVTAALGVACGGSTAGEVDDRYGVANQLSGSTYGQAGAGGAGPTGQAGTAGTAGTGGGAAMPPPMMPAAPAAPDAPSGPPQECNRTPAPADGTLVDFGTYTPRDGTSGGAWGDMGLGQITGGTSVYSGDTGSALIITVAEGELNLRASMQPAQAYTGIVLWFAPCVNAGAFTGLSFPISGSLGGAQMLVKAQTSPNYPVDVSNAKGKCEYPREDMKFTTCQQPTATITELAENPLTLTWDEFVGGTPIATLDSEQLLGFELQFQCQAGNCALDVTVGDVHLISE